MGTNQPTRTDKEVTVQSSVLSASCSITRYIFILVICTCALNNQIDFSSTEHENLACNFDWMSNNQPSRADMEIAA